MEANQVLMDRRTEKPSVLTTQNGVPASEEANPGTCKSAMKLEGVLLSEMNRSQEDTD